MLIKINNKSELSPQRANLRVNSVIDQGKISLHIGTLGFKRLTTFDDCIVECKLLRGGEHSFKVMEL